MSRPRVRIGVVASFNKGTWWGKIAFTDGTPTTEFHGTCVIGMTPTAPPAVGDRVEVIYSDFKRTNLLSVKLIARSNS